SAGIAVSPDGTRIYALGIDPSGGSSRDLGGSTGIEVFDAQSLAAIGRWPPTSDFVSIAVSSDGRLVYTAGSPRVSAAGRVAGQPASVTVFDASDGSIRLIAGSLGEQMLTFPSTQLR